MKKQRQAAWVFLLLMLLGGCGKQAGPPSENSTSVISHSEITDGGTPLSSVIPEESAANKSYYRAPKITPAKFHEKSALGEPGAQIDVSAVNEGYVAVSATSKARLKFRVVKGEEAYNYDLPNDGTPTIYSLQGGDGTYEFYIMENVSGTSYAQLFTTKAEVKFKDEFQPFLHACQYADYTSSSACVKKAAELAGQQKTQLEAAEAIIQYICKTVTYDKEKAATVAKGYIPSPDDTMSTGTGICFDYASLAASMLRSQGIPTKIIFGYVSPGDVYHAWNMFFTEESGWILVEYKVQGKNWTRMDCTFLANGADIATVGDGNNYTDIYVY